MKTSILAIALILTVCVSCRLIDTLTGDDNASTVESLWPDVPPIDGATKTDVKMPLFARLAIRAAMQGKVNFIAFTTSKSPLEVENYYSNERMKSAGWTPNDKGCVADTESKDKSKSAVCFFTRKSEDKDEGLAIVLAQDPKSKETDIFYARIDMTQPSPSPTK